MNEQKGVPLYTGDVIRFDQTRHQGGSSTSDRYRVPAGGIHRAGHLINHYPEDAPYLTDEKSAQATRSQRPRPPVFADADYGDEPRRARPRVPIPPPDASTRTRWKRVCYRVASSIPGGCSPLWG